MVDIYGYGYYVITAYGYMVIYMCHNSIWLLLWSYICVIIPYGYMVIYICHNSMWLYGYIWLHGHKYVNYSVNFGKFHHQR